MSDVQRGKHGRPAEKQAVTIPPAIEALALRMRDNKTYDWSITGGWLVMRQWHNHTSYSIIIAKIVSESATYQEL